LEGRWKITTKLEEGWNDVQVVNCTILGTAQDLGKKEKNSGSMSSVTNHLSLRKTKKEGMGVKF
jgi:hypothetical protein